MASTAGLKFDTTRPFVGDVNLNATEDKYLWEVQTRHDAGIIYIDDADSEAWDLPPSQRFPWDQDKGLYFLNAFHSLHCVVSHGLSSFLLWLRIADPC